MTPSPMHVVGGSPGGERLDVPRGQPLPRLYVVAAFVGALFVGSGTGLVLATAGTGTVRPPVVEEGRSGACILPGWRS